VSRYGLDKVAHVAAYAVLGLLAARATRPARLLPALLWGAVAAAAVGAADEWNQQWSTERFSDALDWVADVAGGLLGGWASTRGRKRARAAN
jgi:VanZ family protein